MENEHLSLYPIPKNKNNLRTLDAEFLKIIENIQN